MHVDPADGHRGVTSHQRVQRVGGRFGRQQGGQHRGGQARRLEQGFGQGGPSGFGQDADQVHVAQPETTG